jgi:tmRNA-binding protein
MDTNKPRFSKNRLIVLAILIALTIYFARNWSDVKAGFRDGWNDADKKEQTQD